MNENSNRPSIRCLNDKNFFDLMKKEKPNDRDHSIQEQIATEELVKLEYFDFIESRTDDPE